MFKTKFNTKDKVTLYFGFQLFITNQFPSGFYLSIRLKPDLVFKLSSAAKIKFKTRFILKDKTTQCQLLNRSQSQ